MGGLVRPTDESWKGCSCSCDGRTDLALGIDRLVGLHFRAVVCFLSSCLILERRLVLSRRSVPLCLDRFRDRGGLRLVVIIRCLVLFLQLLDNGGPDGGAEEIECCLRALGLGDNVWA